MNKIYTKRELINDICKSTGLTIQQVKLVFDSTSKVVKKQLKAGYKVKTANGSIELVTKKPRRIYNPRTKKMEMAKAKTSPKFRFSEEFKEGIN